MFLLTHCYSRLYAFSLTMAITLNGFAAQLLNFEGKAINPETSDLLYVENHQAILNDAGEYLSAYITYSNPTGEIFAEKTLDYTKNALAPDMMFHDKRSDERISVFLNKAENYLQVLIETNENRKLSKVKLSEPLLVVDAGFDRLIDSRWNALRKDKELKFTFLAIMRAQLINFEAIEVKANTNSVSLELQPRNFFIDLLVDPILLEYELNTKRLLRFEGLTNIEKFKNGKRTEENYVARIDYTYRPLKSFSMSSQKRLIQH